MPPTLLQQILSHSQSPLIAVIDVIVSLVSLLLHLFSFCQLFLVVNTACRYPHYLLSIPPHVPKLLYVIRWIGSASFCLPACLLSCLSNYEEDRKAVCSLPAFFCPYETIVLLWGQRGEGGGDKTKKGQRETQWIPDMHFFPSVTNKIIVVRRFYFKKRS